MQSNFLFQRRLNQSNIDSTLRDYLSSIEQISSIESQLKGVDFFASLKREKLGCGPYPNVSMFEAANRIMTDIVILKGVKWLLDSPSIPFDEFLVEYGNEDNRAHDITAEMNGSLLAAEAFNVAPSFFQTKKRLSVNKLTSSNLRYDYKLVIANSDAVRAGYTPKPAKGFSYLFIDVNSDSGEFFTSPFESIN